MTSGYVVKLLDNLQRLVDNDEDIREQIDAAKDIVGNNRDANPDEWDALNGKVDNLPDEEPNRAGDDRAVSEGLTANQRLVSGDEPGTGSNPIGYPGTDQDQDGPAKPNRNVPGVKPVKDK